MLFGWYAFMGPDTSSPLVFGGLGFVWRDPFFISEECIFPLNDCLVSCFNPIEKYSSNFIISQSRVESNEYMKPPPICCWKKTNMSRKIVVSWTILCFLPFWGQVKALFSGGRLLLNLPQTNSSHLKMDAWNTIRLPFGIECFPISFRRFSD